MADIKETIKKEIEKILPEVKKNISKANDDMIKLMKEGEKNLVAAYSNAKKKTEEVVLKLKREELYYELGKLTVHLLTPDQLKDKNVLKIYTEIQRVNKKLRIKK